MQAPCRHPQLQRDMCPGRRQLAAPRCGNRPSSSRWWARPAAIAAPERSTSPPESPSPGSYADGEAPEVPKGLNKYSRTITQPKAQGASQAQLFGTGLRMEDIDKPQVVQLYETPSTFRCQQLSLAAHCMAAV